MDRHALFETAKRLWPDGVTLASKSSHEEALNNIYWRIEEQLSGRPDDWLQLAAWAFHQPLWEIAESGGDTGRMTLRTNDVTFEAFDRWMRKNLSDASRAKERAEYGTAPAQG